jgi:hypothetical protein
MNSYQNPKVLGAFLVGFAIVAGTYVYATFGKPRLPAPEQAATVAEAAPPRVFIPVTDTDTDGVEDWRDQFVTGPAVTVNATGVEYVPPTTATGQLGVSLMEDLIKMKAGGPVARTTEQVVVSAVENLEKTTAKDTIYDVKDIIIVPNSSPEAVRAYGNALADIILTYNVPGLDNELLILRDHITSPQTVDNSGLVKLSQMYKNYRDNTLVTPVPKEFVKVHLDLINVYSALYANIDAMAKADADPVVALVRLKRYEDDAKGLTMALNQVYNAIIPYASVFEANDPAIVFVNFYKESP